MVNRLIYIGLLAFMLLGASGVNAEPVPKSVSNQIVRAIELLTQEKSRLTFNLQNNKTEIFVSVCIGRNGSYGVVPYNTATTSCWIFDEIVRQLKPTNQYEAAFKTEAELSNLVNVFLAKQPDSNKGVWISQQQTVCYCTTDGQESRNYCLKNADQTPGEASTESGKRASNAGSYILLGGVIAVVMVALGLAEYKAGCMRAVCKEYMTM